MSGVFLREYPNTRQLLVLAIGFCGVFIVIQPTGENVDWLGSGAAIFGSLMFAGLGLHTRYLAKTESTELMVFTGALFFLLVTGLSLPFVWQPVSVLLISPLIAMGGGGILGQYTLVSAFRHAPVYIVGPIEYTGLLWAILFGWLFFGDFPSLVVLAGAALIVASCIGVVTLEKNR